MRRRKPPKLVYHGIDSTDSWPLEQAMEIFAAYHRRFKHTDANLVCICGVGDFSNSHYQMSKSRNVDAKAKKKGSTMYTFI